MKIQLNVDYSEKDEAKVLGAQWDSMNKKWYLWDYKKIDSLKKWIPDSDIYDVFITDSLYIIEGFRRCWKCKQSIPVYAIGAEKFAYKCDDGSWKFSSSFHLINHIERYSYAVHEKIMKVTAGCLQLHFSKTVEMRYLMNLCIACDAPQGDNYLYDEIDAVFAPESAEDAANMKIHKIPLDFDIGLKGELFSCWADGNDTNTLIWNYAVK